MNAPMTYAYAPIRKTNDKEWIDLTLLRCSIEEVVNSVRGVKLQIPAWDKENPVTRISHIRLEELK